MRSIRAENNLHRFVHRYSVNVRAHRLCAICWMYMWAPCVYIDRFCRFILLVDEIWRFAISLSIHGFRQKIHSFLFSKQPANMTTLEMKRPRIMNWEPYWHLDGVRYSTRSKTKLCHVRSENIEAMHNKVNSNGGGDKQPFHIYERRAIQFHCLFYWRLSFTMRRKICASMTSCDLYNLCPVCVSLKK